MSPLYIGADNIVVVSDLVDTLDLLSAAEVAGATVALTLYEDQAHATAVTDAEDLAAVAIAGGGGNDWYVTIPAAVTAGLTRGAKYYAVVTIGATDASGPETVTLPAEVVYKAQWFGNPHNE